MPFQSKYRSPTGETRPWTLKEVIQGKPIDRPTHPMMVHIPIAFYLGALGLDVLSRLGHFPAAPVAATWLIIAALVGFLGAATAGIVDRSFMRAESKIRKVATRHMLLQDAVAIIYAIDLAVRWSHRHDVHAGPLWIVLEVVGALVMTYAADLGGQMVFKMGYRVGGGQS